jgi:hypothetical protein
MKLKRRTQAILIIGIIAIAFLVGATAKTVWTGGWEAKAYMDTVLVTGTRGQKAGDCIPYINNDQKQSILPGSTYTVTFNELGRTTDTLTISSNEQVQFSEKATPSGSPDISLEVSGVRHSIINPVTGKLLETTNYHDYVEKYEVTYTGSDGKTHVWYGELHYYAFDVYIRTSAKVLNDAGGLLGWGAVHEGNVATSRGTEVFAIINTVFEISPWVIVDSKTRNFTFEDGSSVIGDYNNGFAGILSSTLWDVPTHGQVPTVSDTGVTINDNCGGHSKDLMSQGVAVTMTDAQQTLNWKGPQVQGLPSKVTLEMKSGKLMAGAYKDPNTTTWDHITATDYYSLYTNVVVEVLQQKDYVLRTGYQPELKPTNDKEGENISLWDQIAGFFGGLGSGLMTIFWVIVILIGLFLVAKILMARGSKVYVGRGSK